MSEGHGEGISQNFSGGRRIENEVKDMVSAGAHVLEGADAGWLVENIARGLMGECPSYSVPVMTATTATA